VIFFVCNAQNLGKMRCLGNVGEWLLAERNTPHREKAKLCFEREIINCLLYLSKDHAARYEDRTKLMECVSKQIPLLPYSAGARDLIWYRKWPRGDCMRKAVAPLFFAHLLPSTNKASKSCQIKTFSSRFPTLDLSLLW
jgi:hypothetical protein